MHDVPDPAASGQPRRRGADPLSQATRRRLLSRLLAAAEAGDANAAAALIELGMDARRDADLRAALGQLKPGEGA